MQKAHPQGISSGDSHDSHTLHSSFWRVENQALTNPITQSITSEPILEHTLGHPYPD